MTRPRVALIITACIALVGITTYVASRSIGSATSTPVTPSTQGAKDAPSVEELCLAPCAVSGDITMDHPTWGVVTLVTTQPKEPVPSAGSSNVFVVDKLGGVRWRYVGGDWQRFSPVSPPIDKIGHIFLTYSTSRYDGVVVVSPNSDGFADFGTLKLTASATTRFYDAAAIDTDGDGTLEIRSDWNDCQPDCGGGTIHTTVYKWDGSDYRE